MKRSLLWSDILWLIFLHSLFYCCLHYFFSLSLSLHISCFSYSFSLFSYRSREKWSFLCSEISQRSHCCCCCCCWRCHQCMRHIPPPCFIEETRNETHLENSEKLCRHDDESINLNTNDGNGHGKVQAYGEINEIQNVSPLSTSWRRGSEATNNKSVCESLNRKRRKCQHN